MWFNKKDEETHEKLKESCKEVAQVTTTIKSLLADFDCESDDEEVKKKPLSESDEAKVERFRQGAVGMELE